MLRTHFKRCLSDLSDSNKDTTPFYNPGWTPVKMSTGEKNTHDKPYKFCPEPWRYAKSIRMNKHLLPYGGGGYIAKLGYNSDTALKVKQNIEQKHWIDDKSGVVSVEFVVFEPANLLLSNVMILFEKLVTGMRRKRIDVVSEYIFPSSGSSLRDFYRLCILLWSIVILVLLIFEVVRIIRHGCGYFKKFFNWISLLQLLSSSCAVLMVLLKENGLRDFLRQIRDDPFGSWNAYDLVKWSNIGEVILSITVVMTTIKCLKLIQINRHIHVMKWTLEAAYRYLCSFTIVIVILALAFAHLGALLFGSEDEEYATLYNSLRTVLQMAIGIGKMRSKLGGDSELQLLAPIFLMACMLCLTIVFTDTFIAILDEAYHQASGREHPGEELGEYMKQCVINGIKQSVRRRLFRKSFQSTIRRKSSTKQFSIQPRNTDSAIQETNGAKLAETESPLSFEGSSVNVDLQTTQRKATTHSDLEDSETNVSGAICDKHNDDGSVTDDNESRLKIRLTKEDFLLCDVRDAMENARTELSKYLCKSPKEYISSRSSLSSCDESFDEWGESTSILSLLDYCEPDYFNNQRSNYVWGSPHKSQGNVTLNVLRRHGHTYIEVPQD